MDFLTLFVIALSLSMDTFAVMISQGWTASRFPVRHILRMAASFGFFQAMMPVIGWLAGVGLRDIFMDVARWVAFGILVFIGVKMIAESFQLKEEAKNQAKDPTRLVTLFLLSLATSLDALATGASFALLDVSILRPCLVIGMVTFVMSVCGGYIGKRFGHFFERKIEIAGGLLLIAIGIKILIQDLIR